MVLEHIVAMALATAAIGQSSAVNYSGTISTGLAYPARMATGPAGGIYVTDPPANKVLYFDSGGAAGPIYTIPDGPVGIAVHDNDGRVFISRNDGKIGVYTAGFIFQSLVDATTMCSGDPTGRALVSGADLAFHPGTNELYAIDAWGHQILVFTECPTPGSWKLVRAWGLEGPGLGQFEAPQAIALDTTLNHVIVTDVDNFRVQVFDTTGTFLFKFGYRILYNTVTNSGCLALNVPWSCCTGWRAGTCGNTTETAWFARSEGVTVDRCSNIYVADALMGTVRVFDSLGAELDPAHQPVIGYGTDPEFLRVPADVMIDADGRLFVANTNNAAVEVYDVTCTGASAATATAASEPQEKSKRTGKELWTKVADRKDGSAPVRAGVPQMPDNPAEIVAVINAGEFRENLDLNRDRVINAKDLEVAVARFGAGTVEDFLNNDSQQVAAHDALVPPHILDITNSCGRCHSMDGAPEGGMLTGAGQENLCQSCHSAGKIAGNGWIGPGDREMNHPWGVLASEADPGPAPGSQVALHLDAGKVRCGTCHEPHEASTGSCDIPSPIPGWSLPGHIGSCSGGSANGHPCQTDSQCEMSFMRTQGNKVNLCGECHVEYEEWLHAGHSDEHADPWGHYDWNMGNNWLCTAPGTPYPYCTGEGVGTAASAAASACTGAGTPLACCTAAGVGATCTVSNALCLGLGSPWACCSGAGTGNCANNLSAAACTGAGAPMTCCTGVGTGSCSSRESCRQCHSGNGYVDFAEDFPDNVVQGSKHRGTFRVVDCLVCHATHGKSEGNDLLRIYDTVWLPTGQVLSGLGAGATCMGCHNGRRMPPIPNPPGVTTIHYLSGGVMLEGINGVTTFPTGTGAIAYTLTNSNHSTNGQIDCTTCHMAAVPTSGRGVGKVGGHTFKMKWGESGGFFCTGGIDDGQSCTVDADCDDAVVGDGLGSCDPDDPDFGFENVTNACGGCHPGLTTFDRIATIAAPDCIGVADPRPCCTGVGVGTCGDYDGNGTVAGVQTETGGLLSKLKSALYAAGAARLLLNDTTGLPATEPEICTAAGTPLACCTGLQTGPTCTDPDAHGENPYWTTKRCSGGTRNGLACNGTGAGTAPFNCPGGGACNASVPTGNPTATVEDAIWNWEYVENSEDLGVKNTGYAIGLLQIAYKGVTAVAVPNATYRYSPAP